MKILTTKKVPTKHQNYWQHPERENLPVLPLPQQKFHSVTLWTLPWSGLIHPFLFFYEGKVLFSATIKIIKVSWMYRGEKQSLIELSHPWQNLLPGKSVSESSSGWCVQVNYCMASPKSFMVFLSSWWGNSYDKYCFHQSLCRFLSQIFSSRHYLTEQSGAGDHLSQIAPSAQLLQLPPCKAEMEALKSNIFPTHLHNLIPFVTSLE